jgi:hypothetical protein
MLVRSIGDHNSIGLHPSWNSNEKEGVVMSEKKTLEDITGKIISASRQHFIRFSLPETYRQLLRAGLTSDYSMGYGSINGFRASVSSSFFWYDLEKEEKTPLLVHPFCFMDANSFYEEKRNPAETLEELNRYYSVIKKTGGRMITIWHNSFLGTDPFFRGWREIYSSFILSVSSSRQTYSPGTLHIK